MWAGCRDREQTRGGAGSPPATTRRRVAAALVVRHRAPFAVVTPGLPGGKTLESRAPIGYHREKFPMNPHHAESAVARLIALAEDHKQEIPAEEPPENQNSPEPQPSEPPQAPAAASMAMMADPMRGLEENPMLKTLLQYRMLMPYLSPMMGAHEQDSGMASLSGELKQSVGDMQLAQRDLRMTVQEQLVQMKRVEEEMHRMREATEKNSFESANLVEDMKSTYSLLKKTAGVLGVMVLALIGLAVYLIIRVPHLLH
jgi:hypothetical protein